MKKYKNCILTPKYSHKSMHATEIRSTAQLRALLGYVKEAQGGMISKQMIN